MKHLSTVRAPFRRLWLRVVSTIRPGSADKQDEQLDRELASHLALLEARFLREGMPPREARLAALRTLGGVTQIRERHRDARSLRWLEDAARDASFAIRSLRGNPSFAVAAILTLAVGIGAATTIYSVVDDILLQPLPFPGADRLVRINENGRTPAMRRLSYQDYLEWRARTTTLSDLATTSFDPQFSVRMPTGMARLTASLVSPNFFDVLRVSPALGRTLTASDAANPDVAVLSADAWRKYFGGDRGAVGTVVVAGSGPRARPLTIVGVLRGDMEHLGTPYELYVPIAVAGDPRKIGAGNLVGRLRDGVSPAAASSEANVIGSAILPARPDTAPPLTLARFEALNLRDDVVSSLRPALRVLVAAVVVVLAIVCANVANLLLARSSARRREMSVRLALGAGRGRIVRQVLAECLVLSLTGGALGAALAAGGVATVKRLATIDSEGVFKIVIGQSLLPRASEVSIDGRLLIAALALGIVTSIVFGLLPALHASRASHADALVVRGGGAARRDTRVRAALVIVQMAMATTLLVGAGLLALSFLNLTSVKKGYDPSHLLAFQLVIPDDYPAVRKAEVIESVLDRARAMPGTAAAGFAYAGILVSVENTVGSFVPPDRTLADVAQDRSRPRLKTVSPGYLDAVGAQVLDGRLLTAADATPDSPGVVVNRTVARRYFGVVGSYFDWYADKTRPPLRVRIVGVVEDIRQATLDREPYAEVFMDYRLLPALQDRLGMSARQADHLAFGFMSFAMRTAGEPRGAIDAVRRIVTAVDPAVGIDAIQPMEHLVANSVARQRFYATTLAIFAAVAAILAAMGTYGVLAYSVVQRTHEIGIRVALGARPSQVVSMVLRRGLFLAAVGIAIGIAGAYFGTRSLQTMLFGVTPLDLRTFVAVAAGFFAVALIASYVPARRATDVDPVIALRAE